jgi:hypothetical protein
VQCDASSSATTAKKHRHAVLLSPTPTADEDLPPTEVRILHVQPAALEEAQAGAVRRRPAADGDVLGVHPPSRPPAPAPTTSTLQRRRSASHDDAVCGHTVTAPIEP